MHKFRKEIGKFVYIKGRNCSCGWLKIPSAAATQPDNSTNSKLLICCQYLQLKLLRSYTVCTPKNFPVSVADITTANVRCSINPMARVSLKLRNLSKHRTKHSKRRDQQTTLRCFFGHVTKLPAPTPAKLVLSLLWLCGSRSIHHSTDFVAVPTGSDWSSLWLMGGSVAESLGLRLGLEAPRDHPG